MQCYESIDCYTTLCLRGIDYTPGVGTLARYGPKSGFADVSNTVVFRPTVQSHVTLDDEPNTFGACHRSLWRSNRVTFCPKKEIVQKKISAARHLLIRDYTD